MWKELQQRILLKASRWLASDRSRVTWLELVNISGRSTPPYEQKLADAIEFLAANEKAFVLVEQHMRGIVLSVDNNGLYYSVGYGNISHDSSAWTAPDRLAARLVWMAAYISAVTRRGGRLTRRNRSSVDAEAESVFSKYRRSIWGYPLTDLDPDN